MAVSVNVGASMTIPAMWSAAFLEIKVASLVLAAGQSRRLAQRLTASDLPKLRTSHVGPQVPKNADSIDESLMMKPIYGVADAFRARSVLPTILGRG